MFKQLVFFELYTKLAYIPKDRALSKQSRSGEIPSPLNKHFPTLISSFFFFFSLGNVQHHQHKFLPSHQIPLTDGGHSSKSQAGPCLLCSSRAGRGRFCQLRAWKWVHSGSQRAASPVAPQCDQLGLKTWSGAPLRFCSQEDHHANTLIALPDPYPQFLPG